MCHYYTFIAGIDYRTDNRIRRSIDMADVDKLQIILYCECNIEHCWNRQDAAHVLIKK